MKNLTVHQAINYLSRYGAIRHDVSQLVHASRQTAKKYKVKALDIFFFMIENRKVNGLFLFEYGFNNRQGREVKETFKNYYEDNISNFSFDDEGNNIIL
jgi:hypothetical protein